MTNKEMEEKIRHLMYQNYPNLEKAEEGVQEVLSLLNTATQSAIHKTEKRFEERRTKWAFKTVDEVDKAVKKTEKRMIEEMRKKVEGLQKIHTHNSIPSLTAYIDEGCSYCLRNEYLNEVIRLLTHSSQKE